jgi:hypothetical protein
MSALTKGLMISTVTAFALGAMGCAGLSANPTAPTSPPSAEHSPDIQQGLTVLSAYGVYFADYARRVTSAHWCSPWPGCTYLAGPQNPVPGVTSRGPPQTPSPLNPIPPELQSLINPDPTPFSTPSGLSALLQGEFNTLIHNVPAAQAAHVQGWSLQIAPCAASPNTVLWSTSQANGTYPGGTVCLSADIVRSIFIELATSWPTGTSISGVKSVATNLSQYGVSDPFTFNGDTQTLVLAYESPSHGSMTSADIQGKVYALDSAIKQLGGSVIPSFVLSMDYLLARQIVSLYLPPGADETTASAAAWALIQKPSGQDSLTPLSTTLLGLTANPTGLPNPSNTQWGVGKVGDAQRVSDVLQQLIASGQSHT